MLRNLLLIVIVAVSAFEVGSADSLRSQETESSASDEKREEFLRLSRARAEAQLERMTDEELERAIANLMADIALDSALQSLEGIATRFPDTPAGQKAAAALNNLQAGGGGQGFF